MGTGNAFALFGQSQMDRVCAEVGIQRDEFVAAAARRDQFTEQ
jgi:hypothetical protein